MFLIIGEETSATHHVWGKKGLQIYLYNMEVFEYIVSEAPEKCSRYSWEIASLNPSNAAASCGWESESKIGYALRMGELELLPLSITVTLANHGKLWADVCRTRQRVFSFEWVTLSCDAALVKSNSLIAPDCNHHHTLYFIRLHIHIITVEKNTSAAFKQKWPAETWHFSQLWRYTFAIYVSVNLFKVS